MVEIPILLSVILAAIIIAIRENRMLSERSSKKLDELKKKIDELNVLLQEKNILTTSVAHEIKNPLNSIMCSISSLVEGGQLKFDAAQRRSLKTIQDTGENVLRMVSDFIDVSRIESGKFNVNPEKVPLLNVINSTCQVLAPEANAKNISFEMDAAMAEEYLYVDSRRVKQILYNIIHNAIKFSKPNDKIFFNAFSDDSNITIQIKDTGKGISEENLDKIFEPFASNFFEGNVGGGSGLGMSLTKSLIELSNGCIEISSAVDKGTVVEVTLPKFNAVVRDTKSQELIH